MDGKELDLANEVVRLTKQIENRTYDYIKRKGNYYSVYVSKLSPTQKKELADLINRFMHDKKVPLKSLKSKRRELLLQIIQNARK